MNCKLYAKIDGKEIELLSGSLKDIDKYTCIFKDSNEFKQELGINESEKCSFYIKAKEYTYDILYEPKKDILLDNNKRFLIAYLNYVIPKEEIISYMNNCTQIPFYKNTNNPMSRLYNLLNIDSDTYKDKLKEILENNYSFYRDILNHLYDENDLYFKIEGFEKYEISMEDRYEKLGNLKVNFDSKYRKKQLEDYNLSKLELNVLSIVSNNNLDTWEKEEELQKLFDNDQELLQHYKEKYYDILYKRNKEL